ncbi:MAG: electron transfer flavoprotein subunit beta/FixA family protein [Bacillota bacterium]|nr:electron transfer flavoprotein subunit beta/FixA family protein [Bacillota bacterium]
MRIVVLVKQVPDAPEPRLAGGRPALDGVPWVTNPFDLHGLEEALRIKEQLGDIVETMALTAGGARAAETLREALAVGIDRVLRIDAPELQGLETGLVTVARVLAAAIRRLGGADLLFCGQKSLDQQSGMLPPALAEAIGACFIPDAAKITVDPSLGRVAVERLLPTGRAQLRACLPAVITLAKTINEPRLASLRGLMKAKRAEIPCVTPDELGVPLPGASGPGDGYALLGFRSPPSRPAAMKLEGTPAEQARALVHQLRQGRLL